MEDFLGIFAQEHLRVVERALVRHDLAHIGDSLQQVGDAAPAVLAALVLRLLELGLVLPHLLFAYQRVKELAHVALLLVDRRHDGLLRCAVLREPGRLVRHTCRLVVAEADSGGM